MAKQQHQNPSQGTSSTNKRDDSDPSQAAPADETLDTGHRAGHVSSTDSMYGTHSSLGAADERSDAAEDDAKGSESTHSASADSPSAGRTRQPTRGGAQTGLTGSVGQLEPGKSNQAANKGSKQSEHRGEREHAEAAGAAGNPPASARSGLRGAQVAGDLDESARVQAGEAHGHSKYSPTADEQDRLSRQQGGEPLRETADSAGRSSHGASDERSPATGRNPREGGHGTAGDDSPTVRSPADRSGKQTATHDIDLAGPDRSGTKRDR